MGCGSSVAAESLKVVPLPAEATNTYIDRIPGIVLLKIKEKFNRYAEHQTKDLMVFNFPKLYSAAKVNADVLKRLLTFFYDNQSGNIKFRHFIVKYATLIKCEPTLFFRILFEIYKDNVANQLMSFEEFLHFQQNESKYFQKAPNVQQFPLGLDQFIQVLTETAFKVQEYQESLTFTTEEDLPFKKINMELVDSDFCDLTIGNDYYLLSIQWFKRWSFYFLEADEGGQKSTKFIQSERSNSKKYKARESSMNDKRLTNSLRANRIENAVFEQPKIIQFQDIEGEYRGELRDNVNLASEVKIVTQRLWNLLCSLYPPEQTFKRLAVASDRLELFPKSIYYLEADEAGHFILQSQSIRQIPLGHRVALLKKNKASGNLAVFAKNFGERNWREIQDRKAMAEVSLEARFLIVLAYNRERFMERSFRKQIKRSNLQPGDSVYAHFAYVKGYSQAHIIGVGSDDEFKIHFKGYSFRYETVIRREDLSVAEAEAALAYSKTKHDSLMKGIVNIGNTCFMNSIIQCLVATPVLDKFMLDFPFNQKKHPIGYALAQMAKCLLNNEKPTPHQFKKIIDEHMPSFSGYHQQDAQEFLNLLLDKLNDELKQKPTIIDYLFGGKIQSKLTCRACRNIKYIEQKMYILSLPIPEAQYNYFSIILVPVTSKSMRKIIFKLHKSALIADYCSTFEERSGENRRNYIFAQTSYNSLKRIITQLEDENDQKKKVTDIGISPNVALLAFEKIPTKFYYELQAAKTQSSYRDYQLTQAVWAICKITSPKIEKNQIAIEYLTPQNNIERAKVGRDTALFARLGSKVSMPSIRLTLRKYNSTLKRLDIFGLEMLVSIPKWATYEEVLKIVERYTENLREGQALQRKNTIQRRGDYIIRLLDSKFRCIFCLKQIPIFNISEREISNCCQVQEKGVPLPWTAKRKAFTIFVDWVDFSKCNSLFCSYIEVDQTSKNVQISRLDQYVTLESCIKLHSQAEFVEMECQNCKEKFQNLEPIIRAMPNILIVHMKEFRYTSEGHLLKLDLRLKWQEFLDSSRYSLTSNGKLYELYALVKHNGSSESGHYTCVAKRKHPCENKSIWVNFDDEYAEFIKQQQDYIDQAYLLLYKKVDMPSSSLVLYSDLTCS